MSLNPIVCSTAMQFWPTKNMRTKRALCFVLAITIFCVLGSSPAGAQWEYFKDHPEVHRSFNATISQACQSTVRLFSGSKPVALGTIIDEAGLMVSKSSELHGELTCQLPNHRRYPVRIIARNSDHDLALLRLEGDLPENIVAVQWRTKRMLGVGSWLATTDLSQKPLAIGVVSVTPRRIEHERGFLGVRLNQTSRGPEIDSVIPHGAADTAGLLAGDIVTHVDGRRVQQREAMIRQIASMHPGEPIEIRILRGPNEEKTAVTAILGFPNLGKGLELSRFATMNALGGNPSRRRADFPSVFQHDTVIQRNECGGPLVDTAGRVAGINIARAGRTSSYAVPADVVRGLIDFWKGKPEYRFLFKDPDRYQVAKPIASQLPTRP